MRSIFLHRDIIRQTLILKAIKGLLSICLLWPCKYNGVIFIIMILLTASVVTVLRTQVVAIESKFAKQSRTDINSNWPYRFENCHLFTNWIIWSSKRCYMFWGYFTILERLNVCHCWWLMHLVCLLCIWPCLHDNSSAESAARTIHHHNTTAHACMYYADEPLVVWSASQNLTQNFDW